MCELPMMNDVTMFTNSFLLTLLFSIWLFQEWSSINDWIHLGKFHLDKWDKYLCHIFSEISRKCFPKSNYPKQESARSSLKHMVFHRRGAPQNNGGTRNLWTYRNTTISFPIMGMPCTVKMLSMSSYWSCPS